MPTSSRGRGSRVERAARIAGQGLISPSAAFRLAADDFISADDLISAIECRRCHARFPVATDEVGGHSRLCPSCVDHAVTESPRESFAVNWETTPHAPVAFEPGSIIRGTPDPGTTTDADPTSEDSPEVPSPDMTRYTLRYMNAPAASPDATPDTPRVAVSSHSCRSCSRPMVMTDEEFIGTYDRLCGDCRTRRAQSVPSLPDHPDYCGPDPDRVGFLWRGIRVTANEYNRLNRTRSQNLSTIIVACRGDRCHRAITRAQSRSNDGYCPNCRNASTGTLRRPQRDGPRPTRRREPQIGERMDAAMRSFASGMTEAEAPNVSERNFRIGGGFMDQPGFEHAADSDFEILIHVRRDGEQAKVMTIKGTVEDVGKPDGTTFKELRVEFMDEGGMGFSIKGNR